MSDGAVFEGLTPGEQRVLASFLAGRMPAGQLHAELCRAREEALAAAEAQHEADSAAAPVPAAQPQAA